MARAIDIGMIGFSICFLFCFILLKFLAICINFNFIIYLFLQPVGLGKIAKLINAGKIDSSELITMKTLKV